ncbi:pirin family protein [Natronospira bacteriovora]|uniref:Pirin family protein n=1 Tax=Natronospira bacteriovora TaxID=3069753 RepID=A0ABU0W4J5_9GAMM|nr:pirin family protein [Natronospira sp. AB-CW4]MDQ2068943.1 pirin family protein [Natronospira sp. AB-CW4]
MSERLPSPGSALSCRDEPHATTAIETIRGRKATLGPGVDLYRLMPRRQRRMVGAWCFLDHFGPMPISAGQGLDVAPHPHIGLHTVTWLLEGRILHRDSLGNEQLIRPGQLNLMTAGRGISHSEESPEGETGTLHGLQLWVAQPESGRHGEPAFQHHPQLPEHAVGDSRLTLFLGQWLAHTAPARVECPLVGAELQMGDSGKMELPLAPTFEHALVALDGPLHLDGTTTSEVGELADLGIGRERLTITGAPGSRALLIGGEPFEEEILMWWNFVARQPEEISEAREAWTRGEGFGRVTSYPGCPLDAPEFNPRPRAS